MGPGVAGARVNVQIASVIGPSSRRRHSRVRPPVPPRVIDGRRGCVRRSPSASSPDCSSRPGLLVCCPSQRMAGVDTREPQQQIGSHDAARSRVVGRSDITSAFGRGDVLGQAVFANEAVGPDPLMSSFFQPRGRRMSQNMKQIKGFGRESDRLMPRQTSRVLVSSRNGPNAYVASRRAGIAVVRAFRSFSTISAVICLFELPRPCSMIASGVEWKRDLTPTGCARAPGGKVQG